jgi:hypothetical protein
MPFYDSVEINVIFDCEEDADEVMAVYQTHPHVQKYDLAKEWKKTVLDEGTTILSYRGDDVKWYDEYEDVKAFLYMKELIVKFMSERNFNCSWILSLTNE